MRKRTPSGIPTPVSATWQRTRCPSVSVRNVSCPPSGMASRALTAMMVSTLRSSAASPDMMGTISSSAWTSPTMPRGAS